MELTIAIIATLALAVPAIERLFLAKDPAAEASGFKRRAVIISASAVLVLNVALQWIQFGNVRLAALAEKKSIEGALALSLWALMNHEEQGLRYLATQDERSNAATNPYLLGYHYMWHGLHYNKADDLILAKEKFNQAIKRGSFVAPSYYFLAVLEEIKARDQNQNQDQKNEHLKLALRDIAEGMHYDSEFSSLYIQRAELNIMQDHSDAALDDVEHAVGLSKIHCYTVNRNGPEPKHVMNRLYDFLG
jgi:hypothetical protein